MGLSATTIFVSGATINVTVTTFFVTALNPCPTLHEGFRQGSFKLVVEEHYWQNGRKLP